MMCMSILSLEVPISLSRVILLVAWLRSSSVWNPPTKEMISEPSSDTSYILMIPLMGQYLCSVFEYRTSIYNSTDDFSYEHLAVLLPSLIRIDLRLLLLILEFDFISRGVIMKRYFSTTCCSCSSLIRTTIIIKPIPQFHPKDYPKSTTKKK